MFFKKKPKKQKIKIDEEPIVALVQQELASYIKRDDIKGYLKKIQSDEQKRRLWDSMSTRKKLKLLRYVAARKEKEVEKN